MLLSSRGQSDAIQRVARLFKIVTHVQSQTRGRPLGRTALAQACGCDVRTIQRDLALLLEAGIPISYDRRRRAYVLPEKGWTFPVAPLTGEDALALALLRGIVAAPGLPQAPRLVVTLDKLTGSLSPALGELMQEAGRVFRPGQAARDYSAAPLTELLAASAGGRTVEIEYRSRSQGDARAWRSVDPYVVEAWAGQFWELHGWCDRNGAIRTFALDQVFEMRETGAAFAVRVAEWDAFAATQGVVGGVRGGSSASVDVVFLPPVAPYARDHRWPPGLTLTPGEAGEARLTGVAQGLEGLVAELLRWRRYCRVEGGPELRARMAEEVQAMAVLYEEG